MKSSHTPTQQYGLTFNLAALIANDIPEPRSHRGHRRSHTRRILVQQTNSDFEGFKASEGRMQTLLSQDLTEMNSISSTTIESEVSGPETAQRRVEPKKLTATALKAAQPDLRLFSELQDSMESILREDHRRRETRQADKTRIKQRMAALIKLRCQGYGRWPRQTDISSQLSSSNSGSEGSATVQLLFS
jgi:hypothetical protein